MKKSGIYRIQNIVNGKSYIGSSKNVLQRIRQHKNHLKTNKHGNTHLQYSYNKHGVENFVFTIVQLVPEEQLIEKEIFYIKQYKVLDRKYGYNKATNIQNNSGNKWSLESRKKLSLSKTGIKFSEEHKQKIKISNLKRKYTYEGLKHLWTPEILERARKARMIPILQYNLNGDFIQEWNSATTAAQVLNIQSKSINACCNGSRSLGYGFQWFKLPKNKIYPLVIPKYKRGVKSIDKFLILCSAMNIENQGELLGTPTLEIKKEDNQQPS